MQNLENNQQHIQFKEQARSRARSILSSSPLFKSMELTDQRNLYRDIVESEYKDLAQQSGLVQQMGTKGASRQIDEARHEKGFEDGVEAFEDLVESVDFPKFVADLLKGVFDANISVMKAQTDDYIRLMKEATKSVSSFIKDIDNTAAFGYLAENKGDEFNLMSEEDEDGNETLVLGDQNGEKVDMEDNEVKAKIMEAKIAMAQEHRAALRETILMGVTRLVVERGKVKAGVLFDFKASREVKKSDKAIKKSQRSKTRSGSVSGGLFGRIFGGPRGGTVRTERTTEVSVSSAKSVANDELKAKLSGEVEIIFKTDYFKLDNFAQMYAPVNAQQQPQGANPPAIAAPQR